MSGQGCGCHCKTSLPPKESVSKLLFPRSYNLYTSSALLPSSVSVSVPFAHPKFLSDELFQPWLNISSCDINTSIRK